MLFFWPFCTVSSINCFIISFDVSLSRYIWRHYWSSYDHVLSICCIWIWFSFNTLQVYKISSDLYLWDSQRRKEVLRLTYDRSFIFAFFTIAWHVRLAIFLIKFSRCYHLIPTKDRLRFWWFWVLFCVILIYNHFHYHYQALENLILLARTTSHRLSSLKSYGYGESGWQGSCTSSSSMGWIL